jgi:sensor histidine kinase YesM
MSTTTNHPNPIAPETSPVWRRLVMFVAVNMAVWTVFSILGALTSLNDDIRHGVQGSYWLILISWSKSSLVLALQSVILYLVFSRWPRWVSSAKYIIGGYCLMLLILMPLQMIFLTKIVAQEEGFSWEMIEQKIRAIDQFATLLDLSSNSAVYFAIVVIKIWQQNQIRAKVLAQAQADSFALQLELEKQRGLALRAQLEPHFVFNALNAISALVRSDSKNNALDGIHELSELLRYALVASEKNWVKFSEELAFLEDYLSLQRMRYGDRLQIIIEGVNETVLMCDCQPLLLQPLVENALRHDLDCHTNISDIHLTFECRNQKLHIQISNPVHQEIVNNPGTGLGLRNMEARLQLAYDGAATMRTIVIDHRFLVELALPAYIPD